MVNLQDSIIELLKLFSQNELKFIGIHSACSKKVDALDTRHHTISCFTG